MSFPMNIKSSRGSAYTTDKCRKREAVLAAHFTRPHSTNYTHERIKKEVDLAGASGITWGFSVSVDPYGET